MDIRQSTTCAVQCRSIGGYYFKGRTGLTKSISSTVQSTTGCFLSTSAFHSYYITGTLIFDRQSNLRLGSKLDIFCKFFIRTIHDSCLKGFYICVGLLRGSVNHVVGITYIFFKPCQHFLSAVVFHVTVFMLDGQVIGQFPFCVAREILFIGKYIITDFLNGRILGRVNF